MNDIMPYIIGCVVVTIVIVGIRDTWRYRSRKSGTNTHPTPADLIASLLDQMLNQNQKDLVTFHGSCQQSFVQVLHRGHQLVVNVSSPGKEQLEAAFAASGITFPDHWKLEFHNKKHSGGTFTLPMAESERVKDFVHDLFTKLFQEPDGFRLKGFME